MNKQFYNAGIAIALLILLAIGILTYRLLQLTNEYSNRVVHTHLVIEHFQILLTYLVDAETGGRGFVITGENAYLEPYNDALQHIDSQMVELKGLTKDNPPQQKRLDAIQTLIKNELAELALTIKVRQSAGFDSAQTLIKENIDIAIMDSIRTAIAIARNQENNLLSERTRNHQMYTQLLNIVLVSGGIAAVLILLVIIILLRFENTRRTRVEKELRIYQEHLNDLIKERSGELKASEQRWATTLASLVDAVIVTDETGNIVFMNTSAETITGQPVKESLHKQLPEVFNIMSGGHRQPVDELIARVVRERVVTDFADYTILVRNDGTEIPIDCNGARIVREDDTLMGVVFVFRDITKQRQAEETLRKQAALLNLAHDAIFVLNAEDQVTFWSRGAEETYGWTAEEAVGRVTYDLLKTRLPMPLSEIKQEAENTGEWNGELIQTRKDGEEIVVASRWAVQWDIWGRHVSTLEINRDITKRKKAEEALRKSRAEALQKKAELETVIRSVPLGLVLFNKDGSARESNDVFKKIMFYSDDQIHMPIDKRTANRQFFDDAGVLIESYRLPFYLALQGDLVQNQVIRFTADGSEHWVSINAAAIVINGELTGVVGGFADITEMKRAEQSLRESEAKFRRIFDSNLLAIAFWRSDGFLTDANQAACAILGCTREEVLGGKVSWREQTPSEMVWRDRLAVDEIRENGVCTPYEKTFIHRDGHSVPVLIGGASIVKDGQGVTYIVDLTQQKENEKALKVAKRIAELRAKEAEEGKRMLDALMENVPEGISISDAEGKMHMISKHGLNLLGGIHPGMSIEEAVRRWTVLRPDGQTLMPMEELPLVRALRGETVRNIEIVEVNSEGRKLPLLCNAAPIRSDGKVVDGIVVWRDITELKKAEQTLRESERNLEQAQRIAHVGSWIWNVETGEVFCSAETFRIYGEEPFSFQPTINIFLTYVHPEDREYLSRTIDDLQSGRMQRVNQEFRIIRKDQSLRHIHSIAETMELDSAGKPHLLRGIGQDITERKSAEKALLHRTDELAAANRDLESFSYSISHDLRNPLQTIGSFADFLMEDYADRLDAEGQEYLRRIDIGVKKMQSLIDDMLSLSRISRQEIKKEDVDLSAITRNYLKELATEEPQRKAEMAVQDNVHVQADPRLIHLALENLLRNAWKFTSKKEVTRIEFGTVPSTPLRHRPLESQRPSDEKETQWSSGESESRWPSGEYESRWPSGVEAPVYFIRDNGAGFDAKFAEKIFEPFKRVHAEKEFSGTGVGLSIVQRVIGRHGGKVWAEGETGKGAIFYFTLGGIG